MFNSASDAGDDLLEEVLVGGKRHPSPYLDFLTTLCRFGAYSGHVHVLEENWVAKITYEIASFRRGSVIGLRKNMICSPEYGGIRDIRQLPFSRFR